MPKYPLILALLLLSAPSYAAWVEGPPLPEPRSELAVAADTRNLYVIGGNGPKGAVNSLLIFDTETQSWRSGASIPGPARDHIGAAVAGGTLYAIGGLVAWPDQAVDSVYAYDPAADAWTPRAPLPRTRGAMGVAVLGDRIYAAGGLSGGDAVADFTVYDPATNQWSTLPPMPTPRDHLMAGAIGNGFHAVGGRSRDIGGVTNAHEVYDPAAQTWQALAPLPTPRGGGGAGVLFGKLYVFGGELPSGTLGVLEVFDPTIGQWSTGAPLAHARHGLGGAVIGNILYAPGGGTSPGFSVSIHFERLSVEPPQPPSSCPTADSADDDGDGFSNGDEKEAGTDPCDLASAPAPALTEDPEPPAQELDETTPEESEPEGARARTSRNSGGCQAGGSGVNMSLIAAAVLMLFVMRKP